MDADKTGKIDFYTMAAQQAKARGSLYVGDTTDKRNLLDFMEMNGWFGIDMRICGEKKESANQAEGRTNHICRG